MKMKRAAIITVAGISSRFNENFDDKHLKAIYFEEDFFETLLYKILEKSSFADLIIIVGGYRYDELKNYISKILDENLQKKILLVFNEFFAKYSSGYSLFLGLQRAFEEKVSEIIFIEGDLEFDVNSFSKVINSAKDVITCNNIPIDSKKSVVVYKNSENLFKYAFNSKHGLLKIEEEFSCIFNSGQCWKFQNIELLRLANEDFLKKSVADTNLKIIQKYFENISADDVDVIFFERWLNCNTREDYKKAKKFWRQNNEKF